MEYKKYRIAVVDTETDPFKFGRVPKPFVIEFYTDNQYEVFWGDDCVERFMLWLEIQSDQYIIYAHNGGKFDFHFFYEWIDNPVKIINGRIVAAKLFTNQIRDSLAIIPIALKNYNKTEIDYDKMERDKRENHKQEILNYLHDDCVYLYEIVCAFIERFGLQLTVGKTAMTEIQKLHDFVIMGEYQDEIYREYYYGGRVQCFQTGILKGPWKVIDVNSMYPTAMRNYDHPVNGQFDICEKLPKDFSKPYFAHFKANSKGALPVKMPDGSLGFPHGVYEFKACSHEIRVAMECGLLDILEVYEVHIACQTIRFDTFVDKFYDEKSLAKKNGDKVGELFAKFMLNSGYGKFGQNPDNFKDWKIVRDYGNDEALSEKGFELYQDFSAFELWGKPTMIKDTSFYDVSIAASITSAARSIMLEGIQKADTPVYCDTDSLICKDFNGEIDKFALGAWDLENEVDNVAIAGKKLYALYNKKSKRNIPVKIVSKGGRLELSQLLDMCRGKTVVNANDAPTFSLSKPPHFITRNFKMTVDNAAN
jgi:hypothetical protein